MMRRALFWTVCRVWMFVREVEGYHIGAAYVNSGLMSEL